MNRLQGRTFLAANDPWQLNNFHLSPSQILDYAGLQ